MKNIVYVVEGETEVRLIEVLKTEMHFIYAGKVLKHNVVQDIIKKVRFLSYNKNTLFVLIFDTDTDGVEVLQENIKILSRLPNASGVLTIPQVKNLEDELCYSCGIKDIRMLTTSKSVSDFKRDFLKMRNLKVRLQEVGFERTLLWSRSPRGEFAAIKNCASKIKLKN